MTENVEPPVLLGTVLSGISKQLLTLETAACRVEDHLGKHLAETDAPLAAEAISDFQAVDLLRQSLRDLGQLTQAMSALTTEPISPEESRILQSGLKLMEVKNLLCPIGAAASEPLQSDPDFFL